MVLQAARSDLAISVVGEDETQAMLAEASANMGALEAKIRSLQKAGTAQAATASKQGSALGGLNSKMTGAAKGAESLFEGLDKTKGAFEKIVGAVGFAGIAITGLVAIGGEVIEWLSATNSELAKLDEELALNKTEADAFAKSMDAMASSISAAVVSANTLEGKSASLRAKLAELQGDAVGAEFERRLLRELELKGQVATLEEDMGKARAAQTKAAEQQDKLQKVLEEDLAREKQLRDEIAKGEMDLKLGVKGVDRELLSAKSVMAQMLGAENKGNKELLATSKMRTRELDAQVDAMAEQQRLTNKIMGIFATQVFEPPAAAAGEKPKQRGGGGGGSSRARALMAEAEVVKSASELAAEARKQDVVQNKAYSDWVIAQIDTRREAELFAIKEVEEAKRRALEVSRQSLLDETQPVYDFADALTSSLVPALSEVGQVLAEVTGIFDKYREGQIGLTEALAGAGTEIVAATAKQIGGIKAEAAVRAIYEMAMGFASIEVPIVAASHFTAAALLTGVATGAISSGGAGGGGAKPRGIGKPENTQQTKNGGAEEKKTVVINTMFGDRQSVAAGIRQAERSTRGTGYTRGVGV